MADQEPPAELAALDQHDPVTITVRGTVDAIWQAEDGNWYLTVNMETGRPAMFCYGPHIDIQPTLAGPPSSRGFIRRPNGAGVVELR